MFEKITCEWKTFKLYIALTHIFPADNPDEQRALLDPGDALPPVGRRHPGDGSVRGHRALRRGARRRYCNTRR